MIVFLLVLSPHHYLLQDLVKSFKRFYFFLNSSKFSFFRLTALEKYEEFLQRVSADNITNNIEALNMVSNYIPV